MEAQEAPQIVYCMNQRYHQKHCRQEIQSPTQVGFSGASISLAITTTSSRRLYYESEFVIA